MELKTYDDCLKWAQDVLNANKGLPAGCRVAPDHTARQGRYTLHDVGPSAITELSKEFCQVHDAFTRIEGRPDGEYYFLYITLPILHRCKGIEELREAAKWKGNRQNFCFFYRKTSDRTRREAYKYAL